MTTTPHFRQELQRLDLLLADGNNYGEGMA